MFLDEWNNKPKNGDLILLNICGDINSPQLLYSHRKPCGLPVAKDITNIKCTVYNCYTDRISDKSVYILNDRLYIKGHGMRYYLDEFQVE